jgi:Uma2 family endonuclease
MSIINDKAQYTADDLLKLPDGDRFELVDGQLVEKEMGFHSGRVGGRLYRFLDTFCEANGLGWVLPSDVGYQCFHDDPQKVRKPDVSFIDARRLAPEDEPQGHCRIAPDLAVEVVSPNDIFYDVSQKAQEYLQAGVRLVWIVDPATRTVWVQRPNESGAILRPADDLTGDNVVPGFRCKVEDLFQLPSGVTPSS